MAAWSRPAPDAGRFAELCSAAQRGALHGHFERLGYRPADRETRLSAAAVLLGLDGLSSFNDLTAGQAGWLVHHLAGCQARAELEVAVRAARPTRPVIADVIRAAVLAAIEFRRSRILDHPGEADTADTATDQSGLL
ncbi:MAG: hypothetical protein ACLP52_31840 [Streptosporangiaceae bacterium]